VIGNREEKFLIERRSDDGLLGGLWGFPGGKRQRGETLAGALARGIREELGIEIEILGKVGKVRHAFSHFRVTLHAYRCRKAGGSIRRNRECRWAAPEELSRFAFPRAERKLLEAIPPAPPGRPTARERSRRIS
jgi:A/G-specific adenine glycosylase